MIVGMDTTIPTMPTTLVALVPLDDDLRRRLVAEHGEPYLVIEGDDCDRTAVFRQLETAEPVGRLVVVADDAAPESTMSELRRFAAPFRDVVYVTL